MDNWIVFCVNALFPQSIYVYINTKNDNQPTNQPAYIPYEKDKLYMTS
jgi:hypothetical protein